MLGKMHRLYRVTCSRGERETSVSNDPRPFEFVRIRLLLDHAKLGKGKPTAGLKGPASPSQGGLEKLPGSGVAILRERPRQKAREPPAEC